MVDLHTHTYESDGTYSPAQLVDAAVRTGLTALAITDHDTLAGYRAALPLAEQAGLELICGIELSTALGKPKKKTAHLLGYWLDGPPCPEFCAWLDGIQAARRDRNIRLAARLRSLDIDITVEEPQALGRSMTGRPHFARVLMNKGYVSSLQEAFDKYLDESAPGYVDREEPTIEDAIARLTKAGAISSLAHPIRLGRHQELIPHICDAGLQAIEVYHSDHGMAEQEQYLAVARKYGLKVTGGSDFHGDNKPNIQLGSLNLPLSLLDELRA